MMSIKNYFTLLFLITMGTQIVTGQLDSTRLNENNVSALITDDGTFFYDEINQENGYEVPKGAGIHALRSMQFWFATKDVNGQLHFSKGGVPGQGSDIFNGPISDPGTYSSQQYQNNWEKSVWTICQSTIDDYITNYECQQDPDCTDEQIPMTSDELEMLNNWPAHGDVSNDQLFYLAPFYDNPGQSGSGDGIYDPSSGDVPIIKGCCATYTIQNDEAHAHTLSNTDPIGIELRIMFYQYRTWDYLNEVTFVDITAINRSGQNYPEFVHSVAIEGALGNEADDYLGCDSLSNTMYFYNADNNDENGYGQNPPAIGIVGLDQNMTACVPFTGSESNASTWNLMKGLKGNGDPWIHPDGYETNYVFSGNPMNSSEWSELSEGNSAGGKKGLLSLDFGQFNDGDTLKQSYAIVYSRDNDHLNSVQTLLDNSQQVKDFYVNDSDVPCENGTWDVEQYEKEGFILAPNPSTGMIRLLNPGNVKVEMDIYNMRGQLVKSIAETSLQEIPLDLQGYESGIYFAQIKSEKGSLIKKIVIK